MTLSSLSTFTMRKGIILVMLVLMALEFMLSFSSGSSPDYAKNLFASMTPRGPTIINISDPNPHDRLNSFILDGHLNEQTLGGHPHLAYLKDRHAGEQCFLVSFGSSVRKMRGLSFLKDRIVIAANKIPKLPAGSLSEASYLTIVGPQAFHNLHDKIGKIPFKFLVSDRGLTQKELLNLKTKNVDIMSTGGQTSNFCNNLTECTEIGECSSTSFVNLQVAFFLGCARVTIIGEDHNFADDDPLKIRREQAFEIALREFKAAGRNVVDATEGGKCNVFPRVKFEDELNWNRAPENHVNMMDDPSFPSALLKSRTFFRKLHNKHAGEQCFLIGNGPSLNKMRGLNRLQGRVVIGANKIHLGFKRFGFTASYVSIANPYVIEQMLDMLPSHPSHMVISGNREKNTRLFSMVGPHLQTIHSTSGTRFCDDFSQCEHVSEGNTVTFVNMQLAFFLGCARVVLIGVDHYFQQVGNPNQKQVLVGNDPNHFDPSYFANKTWQLADIGGSERAYHSANRRFRMAGRTIVDATLNGHCTIFPKSSLDRELSWSTWGKSLYNLVQQGIRAENTGLVGEAETEQLVRQSVQWEEDSDPNLGAGAFSGNCAGQNLVLGFGSHMQRTCLPHILPSHCIVYSVVRDNDPLLWELDWLQWAPTCDVHVFASTELEIAARNLLPHQLHLHQCRNKNRYSSCSPSTLIQSAMRFAGVRGHFNALIMRLWSNPAGLIMGKSNVREFVAAFPTQLLLDLEPERCGTPREQSTDNCFQQLQKLPLFHSSSGKATLKNHWNSTSFEGEGGMDRVAFYPNYVSKDHALPEINLIVQWFEPSFEIRRQELIYVLRQNLRNPAITRIHLFLEDKNARAPINHSKLNVFNLHRRMNYSDAFYFANEQLAGYNVAISNADVWLSDAFMRLTADQLAPPNVFALSRLEDEHCNGTHGFTMYKHRGVMCGPLYVASHDVWLFRAPLTGLDLSRLNFLPSQHGAENVAMYEMRRAGLHVINPCLSLPVYHVDCNRHLREHVIENKNKSDPRLLKIGEGHSPDGSLDHVRFASEQPSYLSDLNSLLFGEAVVCQHSVKMGSRQHRWNLCMDAFLPPADTVIIRPSADNAPALDPKNCVMYTAGMVSGELDLEVEMASMGCSVFVFDAAKSTLNYVKSVPFQEHWNARLHLYLWTLSHFTGDGQLFRSKDLSSYTRVHSTAQNGPVRNFTVQMRTVRDTMELLHHNHIDFLKLSMGGEELNLLQKLADDNMLDRVDQVLLESKHFNEDLTLINSTDLDLIIGFLRQYGFKKFQKNNVVTKNDDVMVLREVLIK